MKHQCSYPPKISLIILSLFFFICITSKGEDSVNILFISSFERNLPASLSFEKGLSKTIKTNLQSSKKSTTLNRKHFCKSCKSGWYYKKSKRRRKKDRNAYNSTLKNKKLNILSKNAGITGISFWFIMPPF